MQLLALFTSLFLISQSSYSLLPANKISYTQFPSSVAIKIQPISSACTAVKISDYVFLTAAHCLELLKRHDNQRLILYRMNSDRSVATEYTPQKISIRLHPQYYRQENLYGTIRNFVARDNSDLALFKIDLETSDIPIQKISFNNLQINQKITVGGHGVDQKTCFNYDTLPCALNMRSQVVSAVGHNLFYSVPTENYLAYLTPGDSGGPVYVKNLSTNELTVVGLNVIAFPSMSELAAYAIGQSPIFTGASGFLKLKNYSQWISKTMITLSTSK